MKMRHMPMLDIDRERMRAEFENFDDMTTEEFAQAVSARAAELAQLIKALREDSGR